MLRLGGLAQMVMYIKFLVFSFIIFNCSVLNKKNLILVNAVEENLIPQKSPMKYFAAPLYIPLGILGGILDVFLVHPIRVLPTAANHTIDGLWVSKEKGYVTKMGAIPFLTIATPVYFSIDWMYHAFGDKNEIYEDQKDLKGLDYDLTEEEIFENLIKAKQKNDFKKIIEILSSSRYRYESIELKKKETFELIISIYKNNKKDLKFNKQYSPILFEYLRTRNKNLYIKFENFLIEELEETSEYEKISSIVFIFQNFKTNESSEQILKKILSNKTDSMSRRFLIEHLYKMENQKQIQKFEAILNQANKNLEQ